MEHMMRVPRCYDVSHQMLAGGHLAHYPDNKKTPVREKIFPNKRGSSVSLNINLTITSRFLFVKQKNQILNSTSERKPFRNYLTKPYSMDYSQQYR